MKIYDYVAARAKSEGKKYSLPRKKYEKWFEEGMRVFFGVLVDEAGTPICDTRNARFFKKWAAENLPEQVELILPKEMYEQCFSERPGTRPHQ